MTNNRQRVVIEREHDLAGKKSLQQIQIKFKSIMYLLEMN